ncbi:MAG: methyl-accepting chemotaxis protein [Spirochaetales bacterium]|nr:methyl-accepting chemotaxis protein [Spirochaetales bacterium]
MSIKLKIFLPVFLLLLISFSSVYLIVGRRLSAMALEQNADFAKTYVQNVYSQVAMLDHNSDVQREILLSETKRRLKELVEVAIDVADGFYRMEAEGTLSREEAQNQAKDNIRNLWFGRSGYYWIDNTDYINILLPPNPSVEGTSRYDLKDFKGTFIVRELVDGAVNEGEAFVNYWFAKPGEEEVSEKIGYTLLFEPWGWVIGTGEYIDNIEDTVRKFDDVNMRSLNESLYDGIEGSAYPFIKNRDDEYIAYINRDLIGTQSSTSDILTGENLTEKYFALGEGAVEYWYTRPGEPEDKAFKKIGYVKYYEPRDWILVYTQYNDDILSVIKTVRAVLLLISALSIIIMGLVLYFFLSVISNSITKASARMSTIAEGSGDLTFRLGIKTKDEMGKLSDSFNLMMEKLQGVVLNLTASAGTGEALSLSLASNVEEIASAEEEMAASSQSIKDKSGKLADKAIHADNELGEILHSITDVSIQADNESAAVEQSSAAVEEMVASINSITKVSRDRADQIRALSVAARHGKEEMDQTVTDIKSIASSADSISEVLTVIDGISSQINLLSMNAAIEAAHAGDAGKGFAVVAEEIRKLAESTVSSSSQIDQSIKMIINQIQETSSRSIETGDSINRIADETEQSSNAMEEILNALSELSQGTHQITEALNNLVDSSANVKQASRSVEASSKSSRQALTDISGLSSESNASISEISTGMGEISASIGQIRELVINNKEAMEGIMEQVGRFKV